MSDIRNDSGGDCERLDLCCRAEGSQEILFDDACKLVT